MEYFLHLTPDFDCLVKISNIEKQLSKNQIYSFLCQEDKLNIIFYPIMTFNNSLPFYYSFNPQNPIIQKNVDVITYPNNNFLIKASPFLFGNQYLQSVKTKQITFGGKTHTIHYSTLSLFNVKIENGENYEEYSFEKSIVNTNFKTKSNSLIVYSQIKDSEKYIVLLLKYQNNSYVLQTLEEVDILEEEKTSIKTYKNLNDFAKHGIISTYNFDVELNQNSTIVYANNKPQLSKHKEIIPFAFFEAVQIKNYKLARFYLSEKLSKKLTDQHIKTFFGNFENITLPFSQNIQDNTVALIYKKEENNQIKKEAKVFKITFDSFNKISNIEEA